MNNARFTENETGTEVRVDGAFSWASEEQRTMIVTYPSGRRYAVQPREFGLHFSIVTPQEVFMDAYGGVDDRPTAKQREIE